MSGNGRTVYIAGAGIAGMTLALALAKFGATVVVIEKRNAVQEVGAGLQISPNARKILNRLGLDRALNEVSFQPRGIDVYPYGAGQPLVTLELGRIVEEQFGAPYAVMHRADLADLLYRACKRFANIDMLFGVRAYDVVSHARGVSVTVDEADGKSRSARAFAFIGADGVNSRTRTGVLMGPEATYSGMVAWRITLPEHALDRVLVAGQTSLLWGPGYHAVTYPLPHRKQVNVALFSKVRAERAFGEDPPLAPDLPWAMMKSRQFDAIREAAGNDWGYWPCSTVSTPVWAEGGIGLIGDAAHAMLPFQAQGAVMAIEDAAVLAPLLMSEADAGSALQRYAALRRPRVERVRRISSSNGIAFHLEWPFTLARNAVVKLQGPRGHLKRLSWLYGYDAASAPGAVPAPPRQPRQDVH
ncbi:MAG: FAD-dependent monooxygenase [Devosia sp.]|uniref:FAD-dependent monooxygenase n=1 Tax=Devosia sp. TaxID=1871048 RepID=UPI001AC5514B|nr:FAD-dependent monooxygenase [Devosia sp.]MBN9314345.1 FAD-dependent monooxygenase [Devosia sp.]